MTQTAASDLLTLLAASPALAGLEAGSLEALAGEMEEFRVNSGEVVIRQGDEADRMFVLLEGRLVTVLTRDSGDEQILRELHPGDLFGEVALLTGGQRTATVRAAGAARLASLSHVGLDRLMRRSPQTTARLTALISSRLRRSQLATHLSRLFGLMDVAALQTVEQEVEWSTLSSGEVLFRQGDEADAAYVVMSGRLRVVVGEPGGGERAVGEVGRGETVGEIALLTQGVRSATVYAVRDTDLARFSQQSFDRLMAIYPGAMTQMTRLIGTRLQSITMRTQEQKRVLDTITIVPTNPSVRLRDFAAQLLPALQKHGSSCLIGADDVDLSFGKAAIAQTPLAEPASLRIAQWLTEKENEHDFVVYVADQTWTRWTERAVSQADHVLLVGEARGDSAPGEVEQEMETRWAGSRAPRVSLVLMHEEDTDRPRNTAAWLSTRTIKDHFHVRDRMASDFERLGRILTGNAFCLVLGGGGARGFAHIGAYRAMQELGIPVDMVGGTSMGAIIGAVAAMQDDWRVMLEKCRGYFKNLLDYTLPIVSMLRSRRIVRNLRNAFDRSIEDFWIPFFCVSTNLTRAEQMIHRRGDASLAIRASISLPGVMPPVYYSGDLLVDGGLLNNIPSDVMRTLSIGGKLIALDVTPVVDLTSTTPFDPDVSGWRLLYRMLNPFRNKIDVPHIGTLLNRSTVISSVYARNRMMTEQLADLYLHIAVSEWKILQFEAIDAIAARGYELSKDRIAEWYHGLAPSAR